MPHLSSEFYEPITYLHILHPSLPPGVCNISGNTSLISLLVGVTIERPESV